MRCDDPPATGAAPDDERDGAGASPLASAAATASAVGSALGLAARWPRFAFRNVREDGVAGLRRTARTTRWRSAALACRGYVKFVGNPGATVWERDWDVLLVLDACRVDLLREVADEYAFLGGPERVSSYRSVASESASWMRRTFASEFAGEVERTAYVTGNPHSSRVEFPVEPALVDEAWADDWDETLRTVPPRPLTDRAIRTWRGREERGIDRMIVHYMQPHAPFLGDPDLGPRNDLDDFLGGVADVWATVTEPDGPPLERVWAAYRDNLRRVLDDVALLAENLDTRVGVTADHGNAVGEFGVYGHPRDVLVPGLRRVPWVAFDARDEGTRDPADVEVASAGTTSGADEDDVAERLRALGYAE